MNREQTRNRLIELGVHPDRMPLDEITWHLGRLMLKGANLEGADLRNITLRGRYFSYFIEVNLDNALISGNITGVVMRHTSLKGAHLHRTILQSANLWSVDLSGADMTGASPATFRYAIMRGAKLNGTKLIRTDFRECDLGGADLSGADLTRANLREANLSGVNLEGANLSQAKLENTNLQNANMRGANLDGLNLQFNCLTGADLTEATGDFRIR